ncbi:MAG: UbiA family prenyltransferase [Roseateles depolymerans]|uniref:UbiA family prenyltransferase n=1 Tax=Roseateles depolymerans TaxID=76731 RepID=A0A2W5FR01_9BURK|nr:MAG: UbiA family prenyltransferase [Roseateles depolymerans]
MTGIDRHALPPLAVDLDGTLIRTDLLHETSLLLLRQSPLSLLSLPSWLARGKAWMKQQIAERVEPDYSRLPYDPDLLAWLRQERAQGRRLVLCTASDARLARGVADHLQLFDEVMASDGQTNLSSENKAQALAGRFGEQGFDYAGNSSDDLPVWRRARAAVVVAARPPVARAAAEQGRVEREFPAPQATLRVWLKALRLHQWLKNLLVFLPLMGAFRFDGAVLVASVLAFFAYGLCASSVYILNDLMDLDSDRAHPRKRLRPFASGLISVPRGLVAMLLLLSGAVLLSLQLPAAFQLALCVYYALTLAYTFFLKQRVLVDCVTLGMLYTLRIIAGVAATGLQHSFWFLAFPLFLFLSLAFVKRYSELQAMISLGRTSAAGRGYLASDAPLVMAMGVASGFCAVLLLALYLNSEAVVQNYTHPQRLWLTLPVVLYWIGRMWMQAQRGHLSDDPVVFAVKDRYSLACAVLFGALLVVAH